MITGFRTKDLILLEDEINACSTRQIIMTDDGSNGNKGLVTQALQQRIDEGADYDLVLAVGPVIMMKFVAACLLYTSSTSGRGRGPSAARRPVGRRGARVAPGRIR